MIVFSVNSQSEGDPSGAVDTAHSINSQSDGDPSGAGDNVPTQLSTSG